MTADRRRSLSRWVVALTILAGCSAEPDRSPTGPTIDFGGAAIDEGRDDAPTRSPPRRIATH